MKVQIAMPVGLEDLVPNYLESKRRDLVRYQAWLKEGNSTEIEKASHKLKGSASSYGFDEMGALAAELNDAAKERDFARIQAVLEKLQSHLDQIELIPSAQ